MNKVYPGDVVRILSWDELVNKYGKPNVSGYIDIPEDHVVFNVRMKHLCGKEMTVKDIVSSRIREKLIPDVLTELENDFIEGWTITPGMVEVVQQYNVQAIKENELEGLI